MKPIRDINIVINCEEIKSLFHLLSVYLQGNTTKIRIRVDEDKPMEDVRSIIVDICFKLDIDDVTLEKQAENNS